MVIMEPVSVIDNLPARTKKEIVYRPFNEERLQQMWQWIIKENWVSVACEKSAHGKAVALQQMLLGKYKEYFPEKKRVISSDDQPFFSEKLSMLRRRKGREYRKHRKSSKWKCMNKIYEEEL